MEGTFHYMLMANQALVHKKLLAYLKDTGLTIGQPKVLEYLSEHDGSNQTEIARGCHIEAASLTSVLNRMEERKLLERRTLNGNRRTCYIFLTQPGRELAQKVAATFARLEEEAFQSVPESDRETFLRVFASIYHNLSEGNH